MSLTIHTFYETVTFQDWIAVLAAALGCGLLMGLERERHQSKEQKQAFIGLRSFCLSTLLGVLCFAFGLEIAVVGAVLIGSWRAMHYGYKLKIVV